MDRFEQFMRKWEPELESMKDMITELHEAKFPDDNVHCMTNPVQGGAEGAEDVSVEGMNPAQLGDGSPHREENLSERDVSESDKADSEEKESDEDSPVNKKSIAMFLVEEDEVMDVPKKSASHDVTKNGEKPHIHNKSGEEENPVAANAITKVKIFSFPKLS
jgi:hypothetical protein